MSFGILFMIYLLLGGIAALMSVIFAESLGVESIQDTLGLM